MDRKTISGTVLTLLFVSLMVSVSNVSRSSVGLQSGPVHNLNTGLDYLTIQGAIDAIETLDGHTILVDPGAYSENLLISKSITLMGMDRDDTVIDSSPYINVSAHNVTISRFTIEPRVYVEEYNNFTITGTRLENSSFIYSYIGLYNSNNSVVSNNEIYCDTVNDVAGIRLSSGSFCLVANNTISGLLGGIVLVFGHNNTVIGNKVFSSLIMTDDVGLGLQSETFDTVLENVFQKTYMGVLIGSFGSTDVTEKNKF